ncbi:hypothetical protein ACQ3I4_09050 [Zafaria sp. Z1313]|uniref:hypothetical protein n=1 Tax=unclassified Zafaria TaxID=2828765 RepID=UPI002E786BDB|nr:hypothetical protein [Zafaria sp. J156]MEE1621649.1 hypothetical protein [Zafaria sp. J156]
MDLSTSTYLGLAAVLLLMAALTWVLLRVIPRTRGKLRAETAHHDDAGRRAVASLLQGWGPAGVAAVALGLLAYLAATASVIGWRVSQTTAERGDGALAQLAQTLAPVAAACVALGTLAWFAARRRPGPNAAPVSVASAGLRPRGALSFGPRWALAIPALTALVLGAWLVVTGLFSSRDPSGRFTQLTVDRHTAADDPAVGYVPPLTPSQVSVDFPGWYYTLPVIAAAAFLVGLAALLLRRLAQAPRPLDPGLHRVDDLARTLKAKLVATLAGAGLLGTLASIAAATGGALATVAGDFRLAGTGVEFFYHEAMLSGYWIYLGAVLLRLLALVLLVIAAGAALELAAARQAAVAVVLGETPRGRNAHPA